jgi:hypothetical protein
MDVLKVSALDAKANYKVYLLLLILFSLWLFAQRLIMHADPTIGFIDPNIWLLFLLSMIAFLLVIALCWWILQRFLLGLGFPALGYMVSQFNQLLLWQQLGFYWASFALLLWAVVGVLSAVL